MWVVSTEFCQIEGLHDWDIKRNELTLGLFAMTKITRGVAYCYDTKFLLLQRILSLAFGNSQFWNSVEVRRGALLGRDIALFKRQKSLAAILWHITVRQGSIALFDWIVSLWSMARCCLKQVGFRATPDPRLGIII